MKNFLRGIIIFSVLFLLWECAETTDPVLPTAAQSKRLLAGDSVKSWSLFKLNYQGYEATCTDIKEMKFLIANDSIFINTNSQDCILSNASLKAKYNITYDSAYVYLKFYRQNSPDTIRRKIIYITDKEFRTEYYNDSLKQNIVASYLAL
jgi:hypothetical protein